LSVFIGDRVSTTASVFTSVTIDEEELVPVMEKGITGWVGRYEPKIVQIFLGWVFGGGPQTGFAPFIAGLKSLL
jgi:hypothetical protein